MFANWRGMSELVKRQQSQNMSEATVRRLACSHCRQIGLNGNEIYQIQLGMTTREKE